MRRRHEKEARRAIENQRARARAGEPVAGSASRSSRSEHEFQRVGYRSDLRQRHAIELERTMPRAKQAAECCQ